MKSHMGEGGRREKVIQLKKNKRRKKKWSSLLLGRGITSEILPIMRSLILERQFLLCLTTNPLFSIATTTCILITLYLPRCLLPFVFSPVTISTLLLLTALLHYAPEQSPPPPLPLPPSEPVSVLTEEEQRRPDDTLIVEENREKEEIYTFDRLVGSSQGTTIFAQDFAAQCWCVGGPLEVIYEEYEGEEEDDVMEGENCDGFFCFTDSDQESERDHTDNLWLWIEEEQDDDEDGMIEISLDEEDLIEIDLKTYR